MVMRQEVKGKEVLEHDELDKKEDQVGRNRRRTMGLKRALQKEKDQNLLDEDLSIEYRIAMEINEDMEYWLGKVNVL